MSHLIVICLLMGIPMGVCKAEEPHLTYGEVSPAWATPQWRDFAAHIVASEARNVPEADIVVACTLRRDVERGWNPWRLRDRWFGWGPPEIADIAAVTSSLNGGCADVPTYLYVGNITDVLLWTQRGMISSGPHDLYVGPTGSTVIGVVK